jgi:hypothetical protein
MREMAEQMWTAFEYFTEAGFSDSQAFELIKLLFFRN